LNRFDEASKTWDLRPASIALANACVKNINEVIKLKDDAKILEYGCGTGLVSFGLSNDTNSVLGMDYSDGMVEQFNKKVKDTKFLNIKAIKHNIDEQDLPSNEFDLIAINMSLHHIKDTNMFADKAYKALTKDGYLCINDLDKEDGTFHKKHNNDGVYHFGFDKEELENSLKNSGFKIIDYKIVLVDKREDRDFPIFNLIAQK
jgi:ubiquinone/menaquinone biosynthesis C-methylase UbiE